MKSKMLTTLELADRLKMHPKSIIRWRAQKKGPPYIKSFFREKERVFYRLDDVKKWEKNRYFFE